MDGKRRREPGAAGSVNGQAHQTETTDAQNDLVARLMRSTEVAAPAHAPSTGAAPTRETSQAQIAATEAHAPDAIAGAPRVAADDVLHGDAVRAATDEREDIQRAALVLRTLPPAMHAQVIATLHRQGGNSFVQAALARAWGTSDRAPTAGGSLVSRGVAMGPALMVGPTGNAGGSAAALTTATQTAPTATSGSAAASVPAPGAPTHTTGANAQPPFDTVKQAAHDRQVADALDISWVASLPAHVLSSIDAAFGEAVQAKRVAQAAARSPAWRKAKADFTKQERVLFTTIADELRAQHAPYGSKAVHANAKYQEGLQALKAQRDALIQVERDKQARTPTARGAVAESAIDPPQGAKTQVLPSEGAASARHNFVSWATAVFGSAAAAKTHFAGMREVPGSGGMWLAAGAATRFAQARAAFAAAHPGYAFPGGGGFAMRDLHQTRQGIGMLGHALGLAFDMHATENPNQDTLEDRLMVQYFGRAPGADGQLDQDDPNTRSIMQLGNSDAAIAQMGKNTMAGKTSVADEALLQKIGAQYDEMAATSARLQVNWPQVKQDLQAARTTYLQQVFEERHQASQDAQVPALKKAIAQAAKELPYPKRAKNQSAADYAQVKHAVDLKRRERVAELEPTLGRPWRLRLDATDNVENDLRKIILPAAIKPWTDSLMGKQAAILAELGLAAPPAPVGMAIAEKWMKEKPHLRTAKASAGFVAKLPPAPKAWFANVDANDAETVRERIAAVFDYEAYGNLKAKLAGVPVLLGKPQLRTPTAADPRKSAMKPEVVSVPVLQALERGVVENDPMPARVGPGRQEVFNRDLVLTLARYGFSPGATYGDTMHFDFIEGYETIPGGRSAANMQKDTFGPKGKHTHHE